MNCTNLDNLEKSRRKSLFEANKIGEDSQESLDSCVGMLDPLNHNQPQQSPGSQPQPQAHSHPPHSKKFNILYFGIAKSPFGTKYHNWLRMITMQSFPFWFL